MGNKQNIVDLSLGHNIIKVLDIDLYKNHEGLCPN